jgi:glucosylglycerate synthase
LADESILSDDFLRELINVGEVDILVGVPTYNDAKTVGQVVQAIRTGLLKYFPRQRAVIINVDRGSRDGTQDLVRAASISDVSKSSQLAALRTLHVISTQYPGEADHSTALRTLLAGAELVRANACAVISPESTNLEPEWLERLLSPIRRDNFDLVTPVYRRNKFDGLLVRNLVYPMTRAMYCRCIREPFPAEFGFSARLGSHLLNQDIWNQEPVWIGAEMYMTLAAITGDFRLSQTFLGEKSRVDQAPADLVRAMRQTVGVLFWSLDNNFSYWSTNGGSQTIPTCGNEHDVSVEPLRVNRKRLHQVFVRGFSELETLLKSILSAETLTEIRNITAAPEESLRFSDELWVRTVYEFAAAYHKAVISRDHIVQALVPLYRGKAYTFLMENRDAQADEVEKNVESLCVTFERMKPKLLELWNGGK